MSDEMPETLATYYRLRGLAPSARTQAPPSGAR